jgi:hypothetical protein
MATQDSPYRMDKTAFRVTTLEEEGNDLAYWLTKTRQQRLAALEQLRQLHYDYNPANARLQRVLTIIERP